MLVSAIDILPGDKLFNSCAAKAGMPTQFHWVTVKSISELPGNNVRVDTTVYYTIFHRFEGVFVRRA